MAVVSELRRNAWRMQGKLGRCIFCKYKDSDSYLASFAKRRAANTKEDSPELPFTYSRLKPLASKGVLVSFGGWNTTGQWVLMLIALEFVCPVRRKDWDIAISNADFVHSFPSTDDLCVPWPLHVLFDPQEGWRQSGRALRIKPYPSPHDGVALLSLSAQLSGLASSMAGALTDVWRRAGACWTGWGPTTANHTTPRQTVRAPPWVQPETLLLPRVGARPDG